MDIRLIRLNNLKYAVHEADGVPKLAAIAEVSEKYLRQILSGFQGPKDKQPRKVGDDVASRISMALKHEPGWMDQPHPELWAALDNIAEPDAKQKLTMVHSRPDVDIRIPQFDTGGAMGAGLELRDQPGVIQSWRVSPEWLQKNVRGHSAAKNLCIVTGFGDSMRPMFNPGDPLLVDLAVRTVEFDAVYFFRVANEGFIKRLQRIPGKGLTAISENKAYQEWVVDSSMDFEVFGRVLKVWRSEDF